MQDIFSLQDKALPNVFTIASARSFLFDFASILLNHYKDDPIGLVDVRVFLPTRRVARGLEEAFLKAAGPNPKTTLLPIIRTLGDVVEDDLLHNPVISGGMGAEIDLLPPVSAMERRLVLAKYIFRKDHWQVDEMGRGPNWATALFVADELAGLLESFYTEQISFDQLPSLVPEYFADHWQVSLKFLEIVTQQWPAYLAQRQRLDPADYRRQLLDSLKKSWDPAMGGTLPDHPVIIAGSTGSMPAVARLMRHVAGLPKGAVILPGFEPGMDDVVWNNIEDPHPQAGFKHLLENYFENLPRRNILPWPSLAKKSTGSNRQKLLALALRPAEATGDWLHQLEQLSQEIDLPKTVQRLSIAEADDEADEALTISIAMRETLSIPGKTAILVTPDRVLGRRVSSRLQRWGIMLDDSAGVPFANTLRGNFLRLVADWVQDVADPVNLLALLKHPLCRVGFETSKCSAMVQQLDLSLRGFRPGEGFAGLRRKLEGGPEWDALEDAEASLNETTQNARWQIIRPLMDRLAEIADNFFQTIVVQGETGCIFLAAHLRCAEQLCASDSENGASSLWAYEDGSAGAQLMGNLLEQDSLLPPATIETWPALFEGLIAGAAVRLRKGANPRLMILGPLEARLQQADLMILGGLNDGVWPDEAATDPFLSRGMRRQLGLPSPERKIGLAAHDFAQCAAAPEILLTRSKRKGRSPAKPSRWLVRLMNILRAKDLLKNVDKTSYYAALIQHLDRPEIVRPAAAPGPCPPVTSRPTTFGVTTIERLMRDPYSIFASHILGLRRLDPLDADLDFAMRGRFYHYLYARFTNVWDKEMPKQPEAVLAGYAQELFERANLSPVLQAFWQSQMEDSFQWFSNFHQMCLEAGVPVILEGKGSWKIDIKGQSHKLTARVDRIDQQGSGLFIYDYKTGHVPTIKQSDTFSPQLQLTALIAEQGGFTDIGVKPVTGFGFVKVLNRKGQAIFGKPDDTAMTGDEALESKQNAEKGVIALLQHYQEPSTPYLSQPRAFYLNIYGDYDHLARRAEWAIGAGDDA